MTRIVVAVVAVVLGVVAFAQPEVGLRNGALEGDVDGNGIADGWQYFAGGPANQLDVVMSLDQGREGGVAQKITCTRFEGGHVMLAQMGTVAVERGKWYEVVLWARGEVNGAVHVSLRDTTDWQDCGFTSAFSPRENWRRFRFRFQASRDCHEKSRFQIWFTTTGTLWLDDISFTEIAAPPNASIIEPAGGRNLVPNSSFECGPGGWLSYGYWKLFGEVVQTEAPHGTHAMRLKWSREQAPVYSFDYYEMRRDPYAKPDVVTDGWLRVRAGEKYVLSAWLRADADTAVILRACPATRGALGTRVTVGTQWARYQYAFTAPDDLIFPQIEVDPVQIARDEVELLIDAVQLEAGEQASDYEPRLPVELAVVPSNDTGIFTGDQQPALRYSLYNSTDAPVTAGVSLTVTDIFDRVVLQADGVVPISPHSAVGNEGALPDVPYGFYRATVASGPAAARQVRLARVPALEMSDRPFGMNHAYPWDPMLTLARQLGITWVRDWSLKWTHVEPEPGRFEFDMTDYQINRPLGLGMKVLCMFPFPSAEWSSSGPAEPPGNWEGYVRSRIRTAYAPKDPAALESYVFACVQRYQDRVKVWEVFNESIFTNYSLPRQFGYAALDYLPLLQAVYRGCKRADPDCQVVGGYSTPPSSFDDLHRPFIEAGGLNYCDLYSLHIYPGGEPEFIAAQLDRIAELMDQHGGRKPIWMTEYAYYGDDDPAPVPRRWPGLVESELVQAQWNTRMCVLQLAHGVEKIFYHIWTTQANRDLGAAIFFEAGGAPRKIAAAQAAMAWLLGPSPRWLRAVELGPDVSCYLFRNQAGIGAGPITVAVAWHHYDETTIRVPAGVQVFDLGGAPVEGNEVKLGAAPLYLVSTTMSADELAAALGG